MKDYRCLTDEELICLLKTDDQRALDALYFRYWDKLLAVALNRFNNLEVSQEIVQNIFIKIWQRRYVLKLTYSLNTYLAVAVKYQVLDQLALNYHKRKLEEIDENYALETEQSVEEKVFEKELLDRIELSVKRLPEKCQIVFRMNRELGMTYKQIAQDLDISEKTVEAHMSKALKGIRTDLNALIPAAILFLFQ